MTHIAVLGGGNIGEALIAGLVAAGRDPQTIVVTNRSEERGEQLRERYGVRDVRENRLAVENADTIVVCVKPKQVLDVLYEISDELDSSDATPVIVSMAAGVTLSAMEDAVVAGTPIVRVMPNTPMLFGKGLNAVAAGRFVSPEQLEAVSTLLSTVGEVVEVAEEDMDAVTALAGSSPAYFFLVAEALVDAGVSLGLTREVANKLVSTSAVGAGVMLTDSGLEPAVLRAQVSSPAGTTVAALRELEESGIRGAFYRATEACARRSEQLGQPKKKTRSEGFEEISST